MVNNLGTEVATNVIKTNDNIGRKAHHLITLDIGWCAFLAIKTTLLKSYSTQLEKHSMHEISMYSFGKVEIMTKLLVLDIFKSLK